MMTLLMLSCRAADYYVSPRGDGGFPGTPDRPWRSLARGNATEFQPGDRILLEAGQVFAGPLQLGSDDRGTAESPMVVRSFGWGRAAIDGGRGSAVVLENCESVQLENLRLLGAGRKEGNAAHGLSVSRSRAVEIRGLEVSGFQHAGISITGAGKCISARSMRTIWGLPGFGPEANAPAICMSATAWRKTIRAIRRFAGTTAVAASSWGMSSKPWWNAAKLVKTVGRCRGRETASS